ncbi:T9SS type A sorting domain-containing protein [Lacinutrix neustonica]|uniref:T9SS type A sorting domain-containing protein n=1 Tax=Lacinutrix neustonica TaxID=2980107 RepID=A0A9E8N0Q4_9FLAO|nr:T9SS type A sorting domain-containing protein [Lacinutrix neustonica]WAC03734.1 T9SS type A sorting domain-containing protein [Lacinutrix neustonica]
MKNIYLSFLLVGMVASAQAQMTTKPGFGVISQESIKPTNTQHAASKALGVLIWSDNFDSGSNWTIDNDGQAGGAYGWTIDGVVDGWYMTNGISSGSGPGFAELSNGDAQQGTQELGVTYTMTSITLDIPNLPANIFNTDQVTLQYQETGALSNDEQLAQISTDGGFFWQTIRDNRDHYSVTSQGSPGNDYPNPANISINLAPYITGNATSLQIRFSWTTAFPQFPTNPNYWGTYGWYIDDVRIFTNPDNDIEAVDPYWGTSSLYYTQIPATQIAPIDFTSRAYNGGLNTQNNVTLNVDINNGAWTGTSQSTTIPVGVTYSLAVSTQYTPAAIPGNHAFTWEITQDEVDDIPANNIIAGDDFDISEYIYAMDEDVVDGYSGNAGFGWEKGNFYDIRTDQDVYSIDVKVHSSSEVGSTVYGKIYSWDETNTSIFADALTYVQRTESHEITQQDLDQGLISLPLLAPTSLFAATKKYFVVAATDGDGGATVDVQIATSGSSPTGFSYFYAANEDTWYAQQSTPIVRLNFDGSTLGLNEATNANVSALNIFPNPATNEVNVSFIVNDASDVRVEVLDMNGKVIETITEASQVSGLQKNTISTTAYATGIYLITIETQEGLVQRKFVKN